MIIRVEYDGTLDVVYDNQVLFSNLQLPGYSGITGGRFGWGARTGGLNEHHWIDNVQRSTGSNCPPSSSIARSGDDFIVTFEGVLETAPSVNCPWTELEGQTNPYTTSAAENAQFFRSRANP